MVEEHIIVGEEAPRGIFGSLGEVFQVLLSIDGDRVLQIDAETKETQTGIQLLKRAIHLSKWFQKQGVKVGDVLSIYSENRLEFSVFVVACFMVGATAAPINPDYQIGELLHVAGLSKPKHVFCTPETLNKVLEILTKTDFIEKVVLYGSKRVNNKNITMYNDIMRGHLNVDVDTFTPVDMDPEDAVAAVLTSSGTTGMPKGVMVTHYNITAFLDIGRQMLKDNLEIGQGSSISVTPMFHSYGFITMLLNLLRGLTVSIMKKFNFKLFLETIQNNKVTFLSVPPPVIVLLVKHPLTQKYDLSSIQDLRVGAAPLGKEVEQELREKFKLTISQAYGMTETTLGVLANRLEEIKLGSVGKIVPGMMVKVIDENGNTLGPYLEGELCFKGPLVMKGYIGDAGSTAAAIDKDGWLHTGDVAYYDKDLCFFIVDRLKELIKFRGYQVAPAELEALLLSHGDILDAAVIGLPDDMSGELPLAFVVKKPGSKLSEKEVQDFVVSKVSPQKKLRGGVIFIDEVPKTNTGKILRRLLRENAKKMKAKL